MIIQYDFQLKAVAMSRDRPNHFNDLKFLEGVVRLRVRWPSKKNLTAQNSSHDVRTGAPDSKYWVFLLITQKREDICLSIGSFNVAPRVILKKKMFWWRYQCGRRDYTNCFVFMRANPPCNLFTLSNHVSKKIPWDHLDSPYKWAKKCIPFKIIKKMLSVLGYLFSFSKYRQINFRV